MSIVEFLPIPEIRRGYKTKEDRIIIVKDLLDTKNEKTVIIEELLSGKQFEWNAIEWNKNVESAISDALPFNYDYNRDFKSTKDLLQEELEKIQVKRREGKDLKGKYGYSKEFLWSFTGVDKDLLRMCPSDHARIADFGGTLLWGGIVSGLAMGYGAHMFTDSLLVSLVVGVVCFFLTIFLDSFITNTMYSDGKETISGREFISSLPRILLGIIQGIVIAAPLQIKIFEPSINDYISTEYRYSILNSTDYISNDKEIFELEQEITQLHKIIDSQRGRYTAEMFDSNVSGVGPTATMMLAQLKENERSLVDSTNKLNLHLSVRDSLQVMSNNPDETAFSVTKKLETLSIIASFQRNESLILPIANLLICFMFILLSLLPIISKMMMADGVYEKMIKQEENLTDKIARIHIEELVNRIK